MADRRSGMTSEVSGRHVSLEFPTSIIRDFPASRAAFYLRLRLRGQSPGLPMAATARGRVPAGNPKIDDGPGTSPMNSIDKRQAYRLAMLANHIKIRDLMLGSQSVRRNGNRSGEESFPATCAAAYAEVLEKPPL